MSEIPYGFDFLEKFPSPQEAHKIAESLKTKGIESLEKNSGGRYEIWVSSNDMFLALSVLAKSEMDQKHRVEEEQIEKIEKAREGKKLEKALKPVLYCAGLTLIFVIGYQLKKITVGLDAIYRETNPLELKIDQENLQDNYQKYVDYISQEHVQKKGLSPAYFFFSWNLSGARKAFAKEDYEKARKKLEKCLKADPENAPVITLLLSTYLKLNNLSSARQLLKEALALPGSDYARKKWVTLQLAEIHLQEKNYFGAEYELRQFLATSPDDIEILKKAARVLGESSAPSQALRYYEKLLGITERDLETRYSYAKLLLEIKLLDQAEPNLMRVFLEAEKPGDRARVSLLLAELNLNLGKLKKAQDFLEQARALNEEEDFLVLAAAHLYFSGKYPAAKESLQRIVSSNPEQVRAKLYLGLIYLYEGRTEDYIALKVSLPEKSSSVEEEALRHYAGFCLEINRDNLPLAWEELQAAYQNDRYIFRRFNNERHLQKFRKVRLYSSQLAQYE